jgi:hypothetical protein
MSCQKTPRLWIRRGRRCSVTPLTISDARPSGARMNRRVARGCRKVTLQGFPSRPTAQVPISPPLAPTVSGMEPAAAGLGGLGHVDHLVCRDGGIAEGHGTRAVSGAGEDRRRPQTLRRLLSTRLPPRLAPPSGAEIRPSRRLQQRHQGAAMALEPSRQLEFEQNHAHDRG